MSVRIVVESGPKAKKFVAYALDWPGWSRGAPSKDAALAALESYRERYRPVAASARMGKEFGGAGPLRIVDDATGTGSTDFWGISFSPSRFEHDPMEKSEFDRKIKLLRAAWSYFDEVAQSVSAAMQKGPRGGGRDRDEIVAHTLRVESEDFAKRLGLRGVEESILTPEGRQYHRVAYVAAMRKYRSGDEKPMRTWTLPFLIRHSAFHVLDHAWEMQDKDLWRRSGK